MLMGHEHNIFRSGIFGMPYGDIAQLRKKDIAAIGVQLDVGFGARRGTDEAPDALRRMSLRDPSAMKPSGLDLGNLNPSAGWDSRLDAVIRELQDIDAAPLVLGGDQRVGKVLAQAMPGCHVVTMLPKIVPDLVDRQAGCRWLGLNGAQDAATWQSLKAAGSHWRTARNLDNDPTGFDGPEGDFIFWLDLSVIDLGHAAGSIGLNPGGMTPESLVRCVAALGGTPKAMVITGLAPSLDTRGISELAAIEAILSLTRNE
jgi:arginase family enzyme